MPPGPNPNRAVVATFASVAVGCGVLVVIAGVILATYSWSATTEVACALGSQQACDTIRTISTIRLLAFITLAACVLLGGAFAILAIVFAARGQRVGMVSAYAYPPFSPYAPPSMPLHPPYAAPPSTPLSTPQSTPLYPAYPPYPPTQQGMPYVAPPSTPLSPTTPSMPGAYDPTALEISNAPPPAGAIPTRPLRARRGLFGLSPRASFLGGLGLALTLAVIVGLTLAVAFAPLTSGWLAQLPFVGAATTTTASTATPQPTSTPYPTATPLLSYAAPTPGPGCGNADWSSGAGQAASDAQCTSSGLLLKNAANAETLTSVYWNGASSPSTYDVRVTVENLSNACGGIGFDHGYRAYVGYVCSSGAWIVIRYDATGAPSALASGGGLQPGSRLIHLSVAAGSVQFTVGAATVYSGAIESGYDTEAISLDLSGLNRGQAGQGYFRDFVYGR